MRPGAEGKHDDDDDDDEHDDDGEHFHEPSDPSVLGGARRFCEEVPLGLIDRRVAKLEIARRRTVGATDVNVAALDQKVERMRSRDACMHARMHVGRPRALTPGS